MYNVIKEVFSNLSIDTDAKNKLLINHDWVKCVVMQINNRLPNEDVCKHLINICINIANYSNNNYPYPGYYDIIDNPNAISIKVATKYIDYVCSKRK